MTAEEWMEIGDILAVCISDILVTVCLRADAEALGVVAAAMPLQASDVDHFGVPCKNSTNMRPPRGLESSCRPCDIPGRHDDHGSTFE